MPPPGYNSLDITTLNLPLIIEDLGIDFARLKTYFGDGYKRSASVGSLSGLRNFSLKCTLPHDSVIGVTTDSQTYESAFQYIWNFYITQKQTDAPFWLYVPVFQKWFLVEFVDDGIDFNRANFQVYTTGLKLRVQRVAGSVQDAEGGYTTFDPLSEPSLWAWYDASQETDYSDNEDVPVISDFGGNDRHLLSTGDDDAKYQTNEINSLPVFRWSAAMDTYYQWQWEAGQDKLEICHAFVVCKYAGVSFATHAGLITRDVTDALLFGENGTTKFFNMSFGGTFKYRKNKTLYLQSNQQAPMNSFAVVNVNLDNNQYFDKTVLQVGLDRNFASRYWLGDIAEIQLYSSPLNSDVVERINNSLLHKYGLL